jgi:hypothetical protein
MKSIHLHLILIALLFNFSCGGAGTAKKEIPKNAEIKFQSERIDIGVIDGKSNANYDFKFSNTGNIPLVILETRGNCHCVQGKGPEKSIEPGDSSVISVSFDPTGVSGLFQRTMLVRSNATRDSVQLYMTGDIQRDPKEVIKKTH